MLGDVLLVLKVHKLSLKIHDIAGTCCRELIFWTLRTARGVS